MDLLFRSFPFLSSPLSPRTLVKCHEAALSPEPVSRAARRHLPRGCSPRGRYTSRGRRDHSPKGGRGAALSPFYRQGSTVHRGEMTSDCSDLAPLVWRQGKFIIAFFSQGCASLLKKIISLEREKNQVLRKNALHNPILNGKKTPSASKGNSGRSPAKLLNDGGPTGFYSLL